MFSRIFNGFLYLILAAIIMCGISVIFPKWRQRNALAAEKREAARRIDVQRQRIAEVKDKQRRFNQDREFVERLARENHRVYPGELVFIFDE